MNLLERANSFLKGKGKKLALTVVPLAALALPASAAPFTNFLIGDGTGGNNTSWSGSTSSESKLYAVGTDAVNGLFGLKYYGTGITTMSCSSGSCYASLDINDSGTFRAGTVLPSVIPFSFVFTATGSYFYEVYFTVNGIRSESITGTGTETLGSSGSGSVTLKDDNLTPESWAAFLQVYWLEGSDGQQLTVTLPEHSFDLNPAPDEAVPEPATALLFIPALGLMLWKRRRARV